MKAFGYAVGSDAETPVSLKEITLAASPAELRRVAGFLTWAADMMDQHRQAFGHEHLRDHTPSWGERCDIIVAGPS